MQRIDASKLLQLLLGQEKTPALYFILAENSIYKKVISEKIHTETAEVAQVFSGKNALSDFVEYAATGSLFAAPKKSIVELPDKMTPKQWDEEKKELARLPVSPEVSAWFFAPLAYRNLNFEGSNQAYLCYEPNEIELQRCAELLLHRYKSLRVKTKQEVTEIARLALESYTNDLVSCDMHFARMEKANLSFSAALAGNPEVNGFHVAEALALGDSYLIELRLLQCEECGEPAANVFMALVSFFKQIALVQAELELSNNLKNAFEKAFIPFPAQGRIQKALQVIQKEKIIRFFISAAKIELQLRTQKNPHRWLSTELIGLLA